GALVSATLRTGSPQYQMIGTVDSARKILPAEYSILDLSLPALIGLNVGLGAGLLGAYLPDQTRYGPSWKRIVLVDLAVGAGALAGGVAGCVAESACLLADPGSEARAKAAGTALLGSALGLAA